MHFQRFCRVLCLGPGSGHALGMFLLIVPYWVKSIICRGIVQANEVGWFLANAGARMLPVLRPKFNIAICNRSSNKMFAPARRTLAILGASCPSCPNGAAKVEQHVHKLLPQSAQQCPLAPTPKRGFRPKPSVVTPALPTHMGG